MTSRFSLELRLWLLGVILALPFVGRAYLVDDHYQLLMARGLLEHPLRPYDFRADDDGLDNAGWERGGFPRMVNPPVHHYLMAGLLALSGDPTLGPSPQNPEGGRLIWVVRLGMAAFAALSLPLLSLLSRRFLAPPGPVAALAAVTPAFWLSSYALLIDSTMLTFFLGGLVCWVEGIKRRRRSLLSAAGILMGLTLLTKYTGAFVVILGGLYWLLDGGDGEGRRRPSDLIFLLIPAAMLGGWSLWNVATYGAPHLTESSKRVMQSFDWTHVLSFLTFLSGVLLFPLEGWPWAWRRGRLFAASAAGAAGAFAVFLASSRGGFTPLQASLLALLSVGGALFLSRVLADGPDGRARTDAFLVLWLLLGTAQMIWVMQWVAARYYLTLLPPAALLTVRAWSREGRDAPHALSRRAAGWILGMFVFSAGLAWGDFRQAQASIRLARQADADTRTAAGRRYYLGDSFTASPLKYLGWTPAFPSTAFAPGDLVLAPRVVMPPWWFRGGPRFRVLGVYEAASRFPLRVMDNRGAAGFYASVWGALPFTFSTGPLERFVLMEADAAG